MSRRSRWLVRFARWASPRGVFAAVVAVWAASLALASGAAVGAQGAAGEDVELDRRSHELAGLDCSSGVLNRNLSLFANGTVRIRDRGGPSPGVRLAELNEDELAGFRARLEEIEMTESSPIVRGPSSETMEQCLLRLRLTGGAVDEYRFPRMAALPLALGRVLTVLDDLLAVAQERYQLSTGLPADYEPRVGDVLVKADGSRHRVVRVTAEGGGVEIISLESPLVVYLTLGNVRGEFISIESRRRSVRP